MRRLLLRVGCSDEPISKPQRIGKVLSYAVFLGIGDDLETLLRLAACAKGELRTLAPGCAVLAELLRTALEREVVIETARQAMEVTRQEA